MVHIVNGAPITQRHGLAKFNALTDSRQNVGNILIYIVSEKTAGGNALVENFPKRATRLDNLRLQAV